MRNPLDFSLLTMAQSAFALSKAQVQNEPGMIVGPIAFVFGKIIDFIFNIAYMLTENHSLGISIIILTIIVRCFMLPLGVKQQKSMMAMQKLNPELQKIRAKYGKTKDPEVNRKMNAEIQALYAKNKVNPLSGCLPLVITMPLFFGLHYIMNQSYLYVSKLGDVYNSLSTAIINIPGYTNIVVPLALPHIPQKMLDLPYENQLKINVATDLSRILSKFSIQDWNTLFAKIPTDFLPQIQEIFSHKQAIERFMGLTLTEASGTGWPGIMIPILAAVTTLMSSYISSRMNQSNDSNAASQQRMMMVVMPLMIGFMTINMAAGVGIYWITSSVFQVAQQYVMNRRAGIPLFKDGIPFLTKKN